MNIQFACPDCDRPSRARDGESWQCAGCNHALAIPGMDTQSGSCPICACDDIYRKKDFPHWLGLTILTVASLGFLIGHYFYLPYLAWGILIGSSLIDGLMYLRVRDVLVCYRCGAHLRGGCPNAHHHPFDLGTAERYRQERIRREQLRETRVR